MIITVIYINNIYLYQKRGKNSGDGFRGKRGNFVTYYLNGVLVGRNIGLRTVESTPGLESTWQANKLVTAFLKPVKEFIDLGFELEAKKAHSFKYSRAYSCVRTGSIVGTYPDQGIDFSRVLLGRGNMKLATGIKAEIKGNSIEFSWDPMLVANLYFRIYLWSLSAIRLAASFK